MNIAQMVPSQMTLSADDQTVVRTPAGKVLDQKLKAAKGGEATFPAPGPMVLEFPVVLPKTAAIQGCKIVVKANAPVQLRNGKKVLKKFTAGKKQEATLDAAAIGAGADLIIDEVPFSDFSRVDLNVLVDAKAKDTAKIQFTAVIDYRLPVESAADYLNYIMTQA